MTVTITADLVGTGLVAGKETAVGEGLDVSEGTTVGIGLGVGEGTPVGTGLVIGEGKAVGVVVRGEGNASTVARKTSNCSA